jgi:hypothetical protein
VMTSAFISSISCLSQAQESLDFLNIRYAVPRFSRQPAKLRPRTPSNLTALQVWFYRSMGVCVNHNYVFYRNFENSSLTADRFVSQPAHLRRTT